ncbi:MAG: type IV pilus twitching motility protein PilT [Planctomycetota bacterium]|jgi:twitching motility protein PilT
MAQIDVLFRIMVEQGSSDLHLCTGSVPMLRSSGDMVPIEGMGVVSAQDAINVLSEIMPEKNKQEFEETRDTDFAYALEGYGRFRANVFMDRMGWGGVFRLIPSEILTVDQLGLAKAIVDLCFLPKGMVLVTGPTGSGKSTTLCAMINHINDNRNDHILTIEDPIEFVHPNKKCLINQREVGQHTMSFNAALRAALREDPDIVLVGEMRDLETTAIALETANTGHLVFGTLHTTTAAGTINRLIDQFPSGQQGQIRTMLGESLKGVIAQNLLKKKGGGRCAAQEILIITKGIAAMIRDGKTYQIESAMQVGGKYGMVLLNDALFKLVEGDKVEPEEAFSKSIDKEDMLKKLQGIGKASGLVAEQ